MRFLCRPRGTDASRRTWAARLRRAAAWGGRAAIALVTLWLGVHGVEAVRAGRAQAAWARGSKAGAPLPDLASLAGAPLRDEDNFARAPGVQRLFRPKASPFSGRVRVPEAAHGRGDYRKGVPADLDAWARVNGTTDLLAFLRPLDAAVRDLDAASRRSGCQWVDPRDAGRILGTLPGPDDLDILALRPVVRILALRALCHLRAGHAQPALDDLLLALRVIAHLQDQPGLVNHTTRQTLEAMVLQAVWEGLASGLWRDAQLAALQDGLGRLDELAALARFFQWERLADWYRMDEMISLRNPAEARRWWDQARPLMKAALEADGPGDPAEVAQVMASGPSTAGVLWADFLVPKGWLLQSQVKRDQVYVQGLLRAVDPARHRLHPDRLAALPGWWRSGGRGPYTYFAAPIGMDFETWFFPQAARSQTYLDLARIACALERHRLAFGRCPDRLQDLVPAFLPGLPADVCTGAPVTFTRQGGSGYVLKVAAWVRAGAAPDAWTWIQDGPAPCSGSPGGPRGRRKAWPPPRRTP